MQREHKTSINQPVTEELKQTVSRLCNEAEMALKIPNYDKAIELCNEAISKDPTFADSYYYRAITYHYQKRYQEAVGDYSRALALDPGSDHQNVDSLYVTAHYNRGLVYENLSQRDAALKDYEVIAHVHQKAKESVGELKQHKKEVNEEGSAILKKYNIKSVEQACQKAKELCESRDYRDKLDAIICCNFALSKDPNNVEAYYRRANAHFDMENEAEAIADYNYAIGLAAVRTGNKTSIQIMCYRNCAEMFIKMFNRVPNKPDNEHKKICYLDAAIELLTQGIKVAENASLAVVGDLYESRVKLHADKFRLMGRTADLTKIIVDYHHLLKLKKIGQDPDSQKALVDYFIEQYKNSRSNTKASLYLAINTIEPPALKIEIMQQFLDETDPVFGKVAFNKQGVVFAKKPSFHRGDLATLTEAYLAFCRQHKEIIDENPELKKRHEKIAPIIIKDLQEYKKLRSKKPGLFQELQFVQTSEVKQPSKTMTAFEVEEPSHPPHPASGGRKKN